jgi:hypothetical protein
MKHKIDFDYNEDGFTLATLRTSVGTFYGTSCKHPDDKFSPSYMTGCTIAEARAWINFCNKQIANKKLELKGLKRLLAAMPEGKPGREYAENLYAAIEKEIEDYKQDKIYFKNSIDVAIDSRRIYINSRSMTKEEKENMRKLIKQSFSSLSNQDKVDKEDN